MYSLVCVLPQHSHKPTGTHTNTHRKTRSMCAVYKMLHFIALTETNVAQMWSFCSSFCSSCQLLRILIHPTYETPSVAECISNIIFNFQTCFAICSSTAKLFRSQPAYSHISCVLFSQVQLLVQLVYVLCK